MFTTFAHALWASFYYAFFAATAPTQVVDVAPMVAADSMIYYQLKSKLDQRRDQTAPEKCYLQLDRTLLQPGETVWFAAYIRDAGNLLPGLASQIVYVDLLDGRGSIIQQKAILAPDGNAAGEFDFPGNWPGGQYTIKAYTRWMQYTNEYFQREITLQKVVLPRLNMKLEFERKAFGAGEEVVARFDAQRLDNQPLADQNIRFTATLDGANYQTGTAKTDASGRAYIRFHLPEKLETVDGLLNVQLDFAGQAEAISRAIPIVLNKIDLQFFAEGGDAVEGLPCRMAFKAVNEFQKPADVSGQIVDATGAKVADFSSFHDGMGAFDFVPKKGMHYTARLQNPTEAEIALPIAQTQGYTLRLNASTADKCQLEIASNQSGVVYLTGMMRDELFFYKAIQLNGQSAKVDIPTAQLGQGIARFTLFDGQQNEQAERLTFLHRERGLQVALKTNKEKYLPREKVNMEISVRDHAGAPVQGQFSMAVVDEKNLSFADDKQGHLLSALLLEQDLKGAVAEPNFYFDQKEPKSAEALDYLLLTQGWRRFEWKPVLENAPVAVRGSKERLVIAGTLAQYNGQSLADKKITLYPKGPSVKTDESGHFEFKNIPPGQYTHIQFLEDQYSILHGYGTDIRLTAPFDGNYEYYTLTGAAPPCVQGVVIDNEGGEPLIGCTVQFFQNGQMIKGTFTNVDGRYNASLPPGTYQIRVTYTGFTVREISGITVNPNQRTVVDVKLAGNHQLLESVVVVGNGTKRRKDTDKVRARPTAAKPQKTVAVMPAAVKEDRAAPLMDVLFDAEAAAAPALEADDLIVEKRSAEMSEVVVVQEEPLDFDVNAAKSTVKMEDLAKKQTQKWANERASFEPQENLNGLASQYVRARTFYAPKYDRTVKNAERNDFRPTIYWNPDLKTDKNGQAKVSFYTSDAITNFRTTLEGIGAAGQAAHAEQQFFVQKPLSLDVKVPAYVISGDVLRLQINVSNKTADAISGALEVAVPKHFTLKNTFAKQVKIAAGETKAVTAEYLIGLQTKEDEAISIHFNGGSGQKDGMQTTIRTINRGFPVQQVAAGNAAQNAFQFHFTEPVEGTIKAKLTAYPTTLDDVLKGMERMLNQPGGCFEQVSSSNYPNLLVLDLLRQTNTVRPEVEKQAREYLKSGYDQLVAYECKKGGFDWWGRDPAHEGLTAYGILEFKDMANVFPVDQGLIDRSVDWLLKRRDHQGGWKRREDWHGWQSEGVLGAYIAWSVAEAGFAAKFKAEINKAYDQAIADDDPYQIALLANALLLTKDNRSKVLLEKLTAAQAEDGSWMGKTHSVMQGSGQCFKIETTALAALALQKAGVQATNYKKAIDFIIRSKSEYGYGSTQSTVLALRALVEFAKKGIKSNETGNMVVMVDGKRVIEQAIAQGANKPVEILHLERFFTNNDPQVEVFFENEKTVVPFDLEIKYASRVPRNRANCPLVFETKLAQSRAAVGETVRLTATLQNSSSNDLGSPMAILGIPAGLTLQPWQLKQLKEQGKCDFYELWDGFAVFHFEHLAPGETRTLNLDLRADVSGTFEAPASQAFLYYDNDQRVWSKPGSLVVQ